MGPSERLKSQVLIYCVERANFIFPNSSCKMSVF